MLENIGIYGYQNVEDLILAPLLTGDPVLLVGAPGTSKTRLIYRLGKLVCAAYEKKHGVKLEAKVINAVTANPDDWVGFMIPNKDTHKMDVYYSPQSLVNALVLGIDEINRQEEGINQNKLYSLVQERKIDGIPTPIRFIYGMMNPYSVDADVDDGTMPLNPSFADRFALVIEIPGISDMSTEDAKWVVRESRKRSFSFSKNVNEGTGVDYNPQESLVEMFANFMDEAEAYYNEGLKKYGQRLDVFMEQVAKALRDGKVASIEGRRIGMIQRSALAIYAFQRIGGMDSITEAVRKALLASFPQSTYKEPVPEHSIISVFTAFKSHIAIGDDEKVKIIMQEPNEFKRIIMAIEMECLPVDIGRFVADFYGKVEENLIDKMASSVVLFDAIKKRDIVPVNVVIKVSNHVKELIKGSNPEGFTIAMNVGSEKEVEAMMDVSKKTEEMRKTQTGRMALSIANYYVSQQSSSAGFSPLEFMKVLEEAKEKMEKYKGAKNDIQRKKDQQDNI